MLRRQCVQQDTFGSTSNSHDLFQEISSSADDEGPTDFVQEERLEIEAEVDNSWSNAEQVMSPLDFTCVTLQDRLCNSILMQ
ncbi:uncharacterized protein [Pocillopora verrucosa]|uniref:uncharacterized protein isoform X2 n=1 Tax=Pocillopora verrucosa TaxID=203993 RepID=UPI00333FEA0D